MNGRTRRAQVGLAVAHAGVLHLHAHVIARLVPAGQGNLHFVQSGQTCNLLCAAVACQCILALACKGRVLYASQTATIPGFAEVPYSSCMAKPVEGRELTRLQGWRGTRPGPHPGPSGRWCRAQWRSPGAAPELHATFDHPATAVDYRSALKGDHAWEALMAQGNLVARNNSSLFKHRSIIECNVSCICND